MTTITEHDVETFSGQFVNTRNPKAETIRLEDIAHALSQTCRYGGHSARFQSVAEHAVFVSRRLERQGYATDVCLAGLHHDDSEAYLGDIPRPMKKLLGKSYRVLTQRMDKQIGIALGLDPELWHCESVKQADNWALFVEARHLLPSEGRHWGAHDEGAHWAAGQPSRIITPDYWYPKWAEIPSEAKKLYLARHAELTA